MTAKITRLVNTKVSLTKNLMLLIPAPSTCILDAFQSWEACASLALIGGLLVSLSHGDGVGYSQDAVFWRILCCSFNSHLTVVLFKAVSPLAWRPLLQISLWPPSCWETFRHIVMRGPTRFLNNGEDGASCSEEVPGTLPLCKGGPRTLI